MGEHMFDTPARRRRRSQARKGSPRRVEVSRAIELAERVLEETTRAGQDWWAVAAMAEELADVALRLIEALANAPQSGANRHPRPFPRRSGPVR
jgi:hypothetical protein